MSQYARIADTIRERIAAGDYRPGASLPSEDRLADEFAVSRVTINRAVSLLRAAGEVTVTRGVGATVRPLPVLCRLDDERDPDPGTADTSVRFAYSVVGAAAAPPEVADALQLPDGATVVVRDRLMLVGEHPARIIRSSFPWPVVERHRWLLNAEAGRGAEWRRMAAEGTAAGRWREDVRVGHASPAERDRLGVDQRQPVLRIRRVTVGECGQPLGLCDHVLPAYQWSLRYDNTLP